jgi:rhodanese-related sulfurtransferase
VLGGIAVAANPYAGPTVTFDTRELAADVARDADRVDPLDVADWIVAGRGDYRLLDVRSDRAFAEYHVPTAEHVPLTSLAEAGLGRQEKLVVYADDGTRSAQAWMLLRAMGYRAVYMMHGGLEGWRDQVLFPSLAEHPTAFQAQRDEKLKALSAYFGGTPQAGGTPAAAPTVRVMPNVPAPSAPAGGAGKPVKKKKEGC